MEKNTDMNTHTDSCKDSRTNAYDRAGNAKAILKRLVETLVVLGVASGCATRGTSADECGFADAAIPAAIEGVVVGAITGRATHNRDAGVAAGGALGIADYQRRQDACQRAVEHRRVLAEQRAQWDWMQRQHVAEERQREVQQAYSEWARNNRCVTRTVDDFDHRVEDRRDCTHVEYGQRYWPGQ